MFCRNIIPSRPALLALALSGGTGQPHIVCANWRPNLPHPTPAIAAAAALRAACCASQVLRPVLGQLMTLGGDDIAALVRTTCAVVGVTVRMRGGGGGWGRLGAAARSAALAACCWRGASAGERAGGASASARCAQPGWQKMAGRKQSFLPPTCTLKSLFLAPGAHIPWRPVTNAAFALQY